MKRGTWNMKHVPPAAPSLGPEERFVWNETDCRLWGVFRAGGRPKSGRWPKHSAAGHFGHMAAAIWPGFLGPATSPRCFDSGFWNSIFLNRLVQPGWVQGDVVYPQPVGTILSLPEINGKLTPGAWSAHSICFRLLFFNFYLVLGPAFRESPSCVLGKNWILRRVVFTVSREFRRYFANQWYSSEDPYLDHIST